MKKLLILTFAIVFSTSAMQPFNENTEYFSTFTDSKFSQRKNPRNYVKALNKTRAIKEYTHTIDSVVFNSKPEKTLYRYGERGLCLSRVNFLWDSTAGVYENTSKNEFAYDTPGNRVSDSTFRWNTTSKTWQQSYRTEIGYDVRGYLSSKNAYFYNSSTEQWQSSVKNEYHFDTLGQFLFGIYYTLIYGTESWNSSRSECSYDSLGNRLSQATYSMDTTSSSWIPHFKSEYTYDSHGERIYDIDYIWDSPSELWKETSEKNKYSLTYDENGVCISQINYYWNNNTQKWIESGKWEDTFNSNGACSSSTGFSWNGNAYKVESKRFYTYTNIPLSSILLMDDDLQISHEDVRAKNAIAAWHYWDFNDVNDSSKLEGTWEAYYSPLPGAPVISQSKSTQRHTFAITQTSAAISITPLTTSLQTKITLFDLRGRTIWSSALGTHHMVQTARLPAGVYLLTFSGTSNEMYKTHSFTIQ